MSEYPSFSHRDDEIVYLNSRYFLFRRYFNSDKHRYSSSFFFAYYGKEKR